MTLDLDALKEYAELMNSKEDLNINLRMYYDADALNGMGVLQHPLVYQVPFRSNAWANRQYKEKREALDNAMRDDKYEQVIWLYERPYRLDAFLSIADYLDDKRYWKLLSDVWIDTENAWQNLSKWVSVFTSNRPNRDAMMDAGEKMLLSALDFHDELVTVYRGCQKGVNENGISWTLERAVAERFARKHGDNGKVITRHIFKKRIIAVLCSRNEAEVLIPEFAEE